MMESHNGACGAGKSEEKMNQGRRREEADRVPDKHENSQGHFHLALG